MSTHSRFSRRHAAALFAAVGSVFGIDGPAPCVMAEGSTRILSRPIPHGKGETLPVIGLGTWEVFDVGSGGQDRAGPTAVVRTLVQGGGAVIDTAPSYGEAEAVVGDILAATGLRPQVFIATKLEDYRAGGEEVEARGCLNRLKTNKLDLLQLHNVRDPDQHMTGVNALKDKGICRYTGITTTFARAHPAAEAIIRRHKPDFLEIDYAIDNRDAENTLLPAAQDAGTAVLVALPFGRGRLFRTALGKKLPAFASDFDCTSWGQFFLKFILSHPAVTCVIPGTDKASHMTDNLQAGTGRLPDSKQREEMIKFMQTLG